MFFVNLRASNAKRLMRFKVCVFSKELVYNFEKICKGLCVCGYGLVVV